MRPRVSDERCSKDGRKATGSSSPAPARGSPTTPASSRAAIDGASQAPWRGQSTSPSTWPRSSGSTPSAPGCSSGWCAPSPARGARHQRHRPQGRLPRADRRSARRQARRGAAAQPEPGARYALASIGESSPRSAIRSRRSSTCWARWRSRCCAWLCARALPLHLDGAPARQCRLARGADHPADHVSDRLHHRAAGHVPFPQIRRRHLRRRHGRHPGAARTRRADRLHHGRRPFRQRLHRRARLDEDARGDRRAADHGLRSGRGPAPAAHRGADHRRADPDLPRLDGGALWRRPGVLALWRHRSRHFPAAPAGSDLAATHSKSA